MNKRPATEQTKKNWNICFTKRWNAADAQTKFCCVPFRYIEEEMVKNERHVYVQPTEYITSTLRKKWRYLNTAKINDRFYDNYAFSTSGLCR